jgi:excinuclease ABC subunit C
MIQASDNTDYELAHEIKKTIIALNKYKEKEILEVNRNQTVDVYGVIEKDDYLIITIMFYRYGFMLSQKEFIVPFDDSIEALNQFVNLYYANNLKPNLIYLNKKYSGMKQEGLKIIAPKIGVYKKLMAIAVDNSRDNYENKLKKYRLKNMINEKVLVDFSELLGNVKINDILVFDNSHTSNTNPVGVAV